MTDREKEQLLKGISLDTLSRTYIHFINYMIDGSKVGVIDQMEYKLFKNATMKRDIAGLAHAYLNMLITFDQYWETITAIVGWDLMMQGVIDGSIKAKNNGEHKEA